MSSKLENQTDFMNGKYEVPMLWKDHAVLPNNYKVAERIFASLTQRLRKDPTLHKLYQKTFENYIRKGYSRKMSPEEVNRTSEKTRYLPHHPVFNPNKPGKIRVVFDAASKHEGVSLNSRLLSAPDLLNNLTGVLMRFRLHPAAISADIEEMFHQVKVKEQDRDSLRFLWKNEISSPKPSDTYQMTVHIFGAKDSPTCANHALKQAGRDQSTEASTRESILKSFYVDDLLKSTQNVDTGRYLCRELIATMQRGGFKLTKFVSNNEQVLNSIPEGLRSPAKKIEINGGETVRALGIKWEIKPDTYDETKIKRGILRVVSSLFDPLGFISPYTAKAKMILQEI